MVHTPDTRTGYFTDSLLTIADQGLVASTPAMTVNDLQELFAALVQIPELQDLAAPDVTPQHFNAGRAVEEQMSVTWDAVLELRGDNGAAPTIEAVINSLSMQLQSAGQDVVVAGPAISAALAENGILSALVNTSQPEGSISHYKSLLHRFLRERDVIEPLLKIANAPSAGSWNGTGTFPEHFERLVRYAGERLEDLELRFGNAEWGDPIPLGQHDVPPFPIEVLPTPLRTWVQSEATVTQTPVDLPAMLALSVSAAAVVKKCVVDAGNDWIEPLNVYIASVLDSANRKTTVFRHAMAPLLQAERLAVVAAAPRVRDYAMHKRILEQRVKRLEGIVSKTDDECERTSACERARQANQELAELQPVVTPKLVIDDCTVEKVAMILAEQHGKIAAMSAEGGIFDLMNGRYSRGQPNFDVYLKGHAGDELRVDRVDQNRPPIFVPSPAITMGLAVQPEVIRGLGKNKEMRGRGLLARFLYSIPGSPLGRRDVLPDPMPEDIRETYQQTILLLCNIRDVGEARRLTFSMEAHERLTSFRRDHEPTLGPAGELAEMRDWAGKLPGVIVRLAGILHLVVQAEANSRLLSDENERERRRRERQRGVDFHPWEQEISLEVVDAAITIGEYLVPHAQVAFRMMRMAAEVKSGVLANSIHAVQWVRRTGCRVFARRDLHQGNRSLFEKVKDVDPVVDLLIEHNFIRHIDPLPTNRKAGRPPSEKYQVNPRFFDVDLRAVIPE